MLCALWALAIPQRDKKSFHSHQFLKLNLNWCKSSPEGYMEQGEDLFASQKKKSLHSDVPVRVLPALFHRYLRNLLTWLPGSLLQLSPCRPCWVPRIPLFLSFHQSQLQEEEISDLLAFRFCCLTHQNKGGKSKELILPRSTNRLLQQLCATWAYIKRKPLNTDPLGSYSCCNKCSFCKGRSVTE